MGYRALSFDVKEVHGLMRHLHGIHSHVVGTGRKQPNKPYVKQPAGRRRLNGLPCKKKGDGNLNRPRGSISGVQKEAARRRSNGNQGRGDGLGCQRRSNKHHRDLMWIRWKSDGHGLKKKGFHQNILRVEFPRNQKNIFFLQLSRFCCGSVTWK